MPLSSSSNWMRHHQLVLPWWGKSSRTANFIVPSMKWRSSWQHKSEFSLFAVPALHVNEMGIFVSFRIQDRCLHCHRVHFWRELLPYQRTRQNILNHFNGRAGLQGSSLRYQSFLINIVSYLNGFFTLATLGSTCTTRAVIFVHDGRFVRPQHFL